MARDRAAEPLQDQYDSRAWLYAFAILAIVALTVAYRLRSTARREWLRIFTNLGVVGVWLGIGAVVLLLATDGNSVGPPPGPTLMIPVVLVVAAAAGTLVGRSEGWAEQGQTERGAGAVHADGQGRDSTSGPPARCGARGCRSWRAGSPSPPSR